MKRWFIPSSLLRPELCALGVCAALAAGTGCVSAGAYDEVLTDRDALARDKRQLEKQVEILTASNLSLDNERASLMSNLEDLRELRQGLEKNVSALEQRSASLSQNLAETSAELEKQNTEVDRLKGTYQGLVDDLESEVASGQIQITQLREGLQVNVSQEILFPSGSAELNGQGIGVLGKVARQLAKVPHTIEVEGHSDDRPIRGSLANRYPSNWELAGARAASVVRLFERSHVDPSRLAAVSYGPMRPVAPNDTPENRALNRRIEIRLKPRGKADVAAAPVSQKRRAAKPAKQIQAPQLRPAGR